MRSSRYQTRVLLVTLLLLFVEWIPVVAAGPSIIMIYGDGLEKPIFVVPTELETYAFLTCVSSRGTGVKEMGNRPYLKIADFWDKYLWAKYLADPRLLPDLRPEWANQHGRLYLPTSTESATVISTDFVNAKSPLPIPDSSTGFTRICSLTSQDPETARRLGIPGI